MNVDLLDSLKRVRLFVVLHVVQIVNVSLCMRTGVSDEGSDKIVSFRI
jgi:hypothetical protein